MDLNHENQLNLTKSVVKLEKIPSINNINVDENEICVENTYNNLQSKQELDLSFLDSINDGPNIIPANTLGERCKSIQCARLHKFHCNEFTEEIRNEIFCKFSSHMNDSEKQTFVKEHISLLELPTCHSNTINLIRQNSMKFFLDLNQQKLQICKTMFTATLGLGDTFVEDLIQMFSNYKFKKNVLSKNQENEICLPSNSVHDEDETKLFVNDFNKIQDSSKCSEIYALSIEQRNEIGERCKTKYCQNNRCLQINNDQRILIYNQFWFEMIYNEKLNYIHKNVEVIRTGPFKPNVMDTYYYFLKISKRRYPVCKKMFLSTLGLKEKNVEIICNEYKLEILNNLNDPIEEDESDSDESNGDKLSQKDMKSYDPLDVNVVYLDVNADVRMEDENSNIDFENNQTFEVVDEKEESINKLPDHETIFMENCDNDEFLGGDIITEKINNNLARHSKRVSIKTVRLGDNKKIKPRNKQINKITKKKIQILDEFLDSIPKMPSKNNSTQKGNKIYFNENIISVQNLYDLYVNQINKTNSKFLLSKRILCKRLTLKDFAILRVKKLETEKIPDSIKIPDSMTIDSESIYLKRTQQEKYHDKALAKKRSSIVLLNIDSFDIKTSPNVNCNGDNCEILTRLCCYNFTVCNMLTHHTMFYWFCETDASYSNNSSFITCLLDYLNSFCKKFKQIIIYANLNDTRFKNIDMSNALLDYSMQMKKIIVQKFLPVNIKFVNECNEQFISIERKLKTFEIFLPSDYITATIEARRLEHCEAKWMNFSIFKDYSVKSERHRYCNLISSDGKSFDHFHGILYNDDGVISYKIEFDDEWIIIPENYKCIPNEQKNWSQLYLERRKVSAVKYQSLQSIKIQLPRDCHFFYDYLTIQI